MENPINKLIAQISAYFVASENITTDARRKASSLIRVHNEKLKDIGDCAFSNNLNIWQNYFADCRLNNEAFAMFQQDDTNKASESRDKFLTAAAQWILPVQRLEMQKERCLLFLQRNAVMSMLLQQVLVSSEDTNTCFGQVRKNPHRRLRLREAAHDVIDQPQITDLSLYRAHIIINTLRRVLNYSEWTLEESKNEQNSPLLLQLQVLSVAAKGHQQVEIMSPAEVTLKCGIVIDPACGKKLAKLETKDYLSLRSNDMRLMAMHKYGIRVKDDRNFCKLMDRLGAAAVTVDLLEVKHSSPVQIIRNGQGSTKGASFILYNSARLETLLRTFDERVESGAYEQLPTIDLVDLSLLKEEEEWQLVFGYISAFPNLIERCLEQLEQGTCATHLIVRYLSGFVSVFSVYYRRIRILTETRNHLMPFVYARIYLIKAVRKILNKTLELLDIEPVQFM